MGGNEHLSSHYCRPVLFWVVHVSAHLILMQLCEVGGLATEETVDQSLRLERVGPCGSHSQTSLHIAFQHTNKQLSEVSYD